MALTLERQIVMIQGKDNITMKTVAQLTVHQLVDLIESVIERKLFELFGDPDHGLELKPSVKARLRRSLSAVKRGERGIPAKQVAKDLGLKW